MQTVIDITYHPVGQIVKFRRFFFGNFPPGVCRRSGRTPGREGLRPNEKRKEELRLTRERLDGYLFHEAGLTQGEMTILSEYELNLAYMEHYLTEYRIVNQPRYETVEKQFMEHCALWQKKLEEEARQPGDSAGGSMEPLEHNLRMTALVLEHMNELKTKWLLKP